MKLSHHLTAISSSICGTGHVIPLDQIDHLPRGLLILGLRHGGLGSDDHGHQGQDRDQHQRTEGNPRHGLQFLIWERLASIENGRLHH